MPRPLNHRSIAEDLEERIFKPQAVPSAQLETVTLTLDGLEALRLADMEGLYQEAAAERMGVSRATFARVLLSARQTVSQVLVLGKQLRIEGGQVQREQGRATWPCPVHGAGERQGRGCHCDGPGRGKANRRGRPRGTRKNRS